MKITQTDPVLMAMRSLGDDDRQEVSAWFKHLENWKTDKYVRDHSRKLPTDPDVRLLETNSGFAIFFSVKKNEIVILDLTRKEVLDLFRNAPESIES